ncbi:hypothetical protein DRE_01901 [Drechslerella stenobrocha 248]|uniref:Uncharacterized protein n=1 Tax=Drechslerella stenobrocha 248 TaxID=1043628 RepID=W7HYU6_9PEZI|nr:hypothetical protein DRE_01901 [Drechslerella stenobrocha 248]
MARWTAAPAMRPRGSPARSLACPRRPPRPIYLAVALLLLLFYQLPSSPVRTPSPLTAEQQPHSGSIYKRGRPRIYITDAALYGDTASLTVPQNKGREANVYLTYIIDHYHSLPDYMVFIHSLRYQWHNEDPMYDGVPPVKNLQLSYLDKVGFQPLRCTWHLGCPAELRPIHPIAGRIDDRSHTEEAYARAFEELFPNATVPEVVGSACGAQFALTREKIRERPLADYQRYRQWLMDTELPDNISGRILEYAWHSKSPTPLALLDPWGDKAADGKPSSHLWQAICELSTGQGVLLQCLWFVQPGVQDRGLLRETLPATAIR